MANAQPPGGGAGRARAREPRPGRSPLQALIYWTLVLGVWGLIFIVAFFAVFAVDLPDTSKLYDVKRQPSISYLDRSGGAGGGARQPVRAAGRPRQAAALCAQAAFVAIEDRRFYRHFGFNPWGIARSQVYNLTHHGGGPCAAARPSPSSWPATCS